MKDYDYVVIGLGAVGSAALYFLSKRGKRILGIDRFDPPHSMGSSHGETRITRLAVGEGREYVKFARRSQEIWQEIEKEAGIELFKQAGGLLIESGQEAWVKYGGSSFFDQTKQIAENESIPHSILGQKRLNEEFPQFNFPEKVRGYFEPSAGFVFPEKTIQAQLDLSVKNGAKVRVHQPVLGIQQKAGFVEIQLREETLRAKKVILSTGGWVKDFVDPSFQKKFKICRQVLHWVKMKEDSPLKSLNSVFMWGYGPKPTDFLYGFPSQDQKTVKIASEQFLETEHPEQIDRSVSKLEQERFWKEKLEGKFVGLLPEIVRSEVCFYTVTEDARFILQPHPQMDRVSLVSACSGHGFKHASALGEMLAAQVLAE